jgi:hypothetical protein
VECRKLPLVPFILIFLTAIALFYGISLCNDFYNWTYFINYFAGGFLGYTIVKGKKFLFIYCAVTLALLIIDQLFGIGIGVNYVSIALTGTGYLFGRYLGRKAS